MTTTHTHSTFEEFEVLEKRLLIGLFNHPEIEADDYALEAVGNMCTTDGEYTITTSYATTERRFEAKVRDISVNTYPDHFIELKKVKELLEFRKEGYQIDYILFFKEHYGYSCIIYDISSRLEEFKSQGLTQVPCYDKMLPSHTAAGGCRNYKLKKVMKLKFRDEFDTFIQDVQVYEGYISDLTVTITPESTVNTTVPIDKPNTYTNDTL